MFYDITVDIDAPAGNLLSFSESYGADVSASVDPGMDSDTDVDLDDILPYDEMLVLPRKKKRTRKESEDEEGHPFAQHTDDSQEKAADKVPTLTKTQAKTKLSSKIEALQRTEGRVQKDLSPTRPMRKEPSPTRRPMQKDFSPTRPPAQRDVSVQPQPMLHVDHPEVADLGTPPVVYMPPHTQGQVAPPKQHVTPSAMASKPSMAPTQSMTPTPYMGPKPYTAPSAPGKPGGPAPGTPSRPVGAPKPSPGAPPSKPVSSDIKPQVSQSTKAVPVHTKQFTIMPPPLEDRKPPNFLKFINHCRVRPGEEGCFEAQVSGKPMPSIKWFRNGQELIPSIICKVDNKPDGTTTLTFPKVLADYSSKITCKIENAAGLASCTAKLIVEGM